jgi:hypothetical protein
MRVKQQSLSVELDPLLENDIETSNYGQTLQINRSTNKNFSTATREHSNKGRDLFYEAVARCYNQDQIISFSQLYTIM